MSDFLSPELCKAARVLLKWSQNELAEHAQIGRRTLTRFENGETTASPAVQKKLRDAFVAAGLIFRAANTPGGELDGLSVGFRPKLPHEGLKTL